MNQEQPKANLEQNSETLPTQPKHDQNHVPAETVKKIIPLKRTAIIISLIVIAIVGGVGLVANYLQIKLNQKQATQTPAPTPTTIPSLSTENWKTYTNTEYNYSLRYPPQAAIPECPHLNLDSYSPSQSGFIISIISEPCLHRFIIFHRANLNHLSPFEFFTNLYSEGLSCKLTTDKTHKCTKTSKIFTYDKGEKKEKSVLTEYEVSNLLVGGKEAVYVKILETPGELHDAVYVPANDKVMLDISKGSSKITDQILSTFKFSKYYVETVSLQGILQKMQRPAPDIPYDHKLILSQPYFDELDGMGKYIDEIIVVPTLDEELVQQLKNSVGKKVIIIGKIEWGHAETRHFRAEKVTTLD